ncbi:ATP-binding cassette domain-containing protein [Streptomyces sp. SP18CS02]|uniref:ATP-binding cassette domain-containing protein n=1 Tax=Streptomyces sp. SP18CS02 TaxID=3002531 RepID=UPI002E75EF8B|nr:ATP-binding cassette domain-containing protein [Streptomyces sp. SP18CS02]MEE1751204.1 ATP-binding cassette domain-containing protein [Streptomyces sp. SP18CS02]
MTLHFSKVAFRYNRKAPVFSGLDLAIDDAATVLLGPNGAGKSTLMALAATHLRPERGSITWRGSAPASRRARSAYVRAVAWLPQEVVAIPGLTVREQVAYAGWLKGMSRSAAWEASAGALARVRMSELAGRRSHQLSGGQKRRMGLAGALAHRSEVILMDEPTAGLDPTQRRVFRDLLETLHGDVQVIVSTHQTEDLADSYSHVIVLDRGTVRFQGPPDDFYALAGTGPDRSRERAEAAYAHLVHGEA